MSNKYYLPRKVRQYVEWQLEHYHSDRKALADYRSAYYPNGVANYEPSGAAKTGTSDPTAQAAVSLTTSAYIATTERSLAAIERALNRCDDTDKQLVTLVYWKRTHTVDGAAVEAHIDRSRAYRRVNKVLYDIAMETGAINL